MRDRELVRGLVLMLVALGFGLQSLQYPLGQVELAGPGLFPLVVSCLLFLVGVANVIRSRFTERVRLEFSLKNIGLIIGGLVLFTVLSQYVNMLAAIVAMVFFASMAAASYSVARNVAIAAGLIAIAFGFQRFLGLDLNLY